MLFNSYEFIFVFLPFTLLILYLFCIYGKLRVATWWVSLVSLVFYAYWNWHFLFLFIISIIFNYFIGNLIIEQNEKNKKKLLWLGVSLNLALLGFFKYTHFFLQNFNLATGLELTIPDIVLPIGISFFTFTQIAYIVDCRQHTKHYRFADYLAFVSFFPHLVAGPILRHNVIIPQIENRSFGKPSARRAYIGILFFSLGLFKKVIVADTLANYIDPLFTNALQLSSFDAWVAAIFYTFQIYFDFSAYSEMAIGLALLMNVRIPFNFNSPYKSQSIIDFWRRWHISLSLFLRDYLYIPLGGNRKGSSRRYINLFITMLLGGLWHGAAWTFVIWGGLHGTYLAINHAWRKTTIKLPKYLSWGLTFLGINIAWVFFRAENFNTAIEILKKMFLCQSLSFNSRFDHPILMVIAMTALICWTILAPNTQQIVIKRIPRIRIAVPGTILLILGILGLGASEHFIYFQF